MNMMGNKTYKVIKQYIYKSSIVFIEWEQYYENYKINVY